MASRVHGAARSREVEAMNAANCPKCGKPHGDPLVTGHCIPCLQAADVTPTPLTDAESHAWETGGAWVNAEFARQIERELAAANERIAILLSDQKRLEGFAATYRRRADEADDARADLAKWESELSKVMPPDFKDWWQNSKAEWPLVARLAIESARKSEGIAWQQIETARAESDALAEALAYARRFLNSEDHDTAFVDKALAARKQTNDQCAGTEASAPKA